jgi:mono/diheme cytochrome c family protein
MNRLTGLFLLAVFFSCTQSNPNLSREEEIKWKQYRIKGRSLYQLHCSNCHGINGEGLVNLYPPLSNVDWVTLNSEKISCIIKNGSQGELKINGTLFSGDMPGHNNLTNLEIAEITAYILSDLNESQEFYDVNEIIRQLNACED